MIDAPILIAGGGPVGMTLALELAHHGVRSILVERNPSTTQHPKMDLTNGRSMELFRRLGLADRLRAVGVPPDRPLDVVWATRAGGELLHRFAYPSPSEQRVLTRAQNDGTQTLEPAMRVSQIVIEPVLKTAIDESPLVDVRFGCAFEALEQDADGVTATIRDSASGETQTLRVQYLAGCDGGGSRVRRALGIELEGAHAIAQAYMVHFRCTQREVFTRFGNVYHLQTALGTLIVQNDRDIWTLQTVLPPGVDPATVDPAALLRQFAGRDFEFEILVANPWTPHMVIAEQYRRGRVFLAGDSAHQVIPTGGYGMNTGIGDAVDLGWKLAAVLRGWGGAGLLDSYEAERQPIAVQNRAAAQRHAEVRFAIMGALMEAAAQGELESPAAQARREAQGARIAALGNAENESWGIEHGYRYTDSLVICGESAAPAFDPLRCTPTTTPGTRLPALFLADGTALHDCLGRELSLLVIGATDCGGFVAAASEAGTPLAVVLLTPEPCLGLLERRLILVRPDQHVAWRGDAEPADCRAVLEQISGRRHRAAEPYRHLTEGEPACLP